MTKHLTGGAWRGPAAILALVVGTAGLSSCSKSDESLAEASRGTAKVADIFLNVCYRTESDAARIKHIAALNHWPAIDRLPTPPGGGTIAGAWRLTVAGRPVILFAASGPDDRPNVPRGKTMRMCATEFFGPQEPGFIDDVVKQVDLKKIDPAHAGRPLPPGMTAMSESGSEDGSLELLLSQTAMPPIGRMVMAFAIKEN